MTTRPFKMSKRDALRFLRANIDDASDFHVAGVVRVEEAVDKYGPPGDDSQCRAVTATIKASGGRGHASWPMRVRVTACSAQVEILEDGLEGGRRRRRR